MIRAELLRDTQTKAPALNPIQPPAHSPQAVMFGSLGGHVTVELQGNAALGWFHNYRDLLLGFIARRAP